MPKNGTATKERPARPANGKANGRRSRLAHPPRQSRHKHGAAAPATAALVVGALGVVFGDIGTSPLYAMKESLGGPHGAPVTDENVLGVLSLIFWALVIVVGVKYLSLVMRADNRGEGGIMALAATVFPSGEGARRRLSIFAILAIFGCGLLFGESVITPVISVLSAIEGLELVVPGVQPWVVPLTVVIILILFAVQRHGTARIGAIFGPVCLVWFTAIAAAGIPAIVTEPQVLQAVNPWFGIEFFITGGLAGFWVLGSVVLAVTGVEALYADMGHFGRSPIRRAWFAIVFPALLLSYMGQGAILLDGDVENPFFELVPSFLVIPMVILATAATVIASQALISGVFSLTNQAIRLGYLPRLPVRHTSEATEGQIYMPTANTLLAIMCVIVAVTFQSSSALAGAYGIAVAGTMSITSILLYRVARTKWNWSRLGALAVVTPLFTIDVAFVLANTRKIPDGAWLPLLLGFVTIALMTSWWAGRRRLEDTLRDASVGESVFLREARLGGVVRSRGTGVFMASSQSGVPSILRHFVKTVGALPEQVIILSIITESRPWVPGNKVLEITPLGRGIYRVVARIGFMQTADVPRMLDRCDTLGLRHDPLHTTYYLGRNVAVPGPTRNIFRQVSNRIFGFLSANASRPTEFFGLPADRTIELGAQYRI